ncbi:hypothetical protein [Cohnella yongneupensis]|uniref:Uncharacterized protein n=1 Tax=Cohnella yongneupensis TaxID=425006 RepID=A0ABW0R0L5_9BACL
MTKSDLLFQIRVAQGFNQMISDCEADLRKDEYPLIRVRQYLLTNRLKLTAALLVAFTLIGFYVGGGVLWWIVAFAPLYYASAARSLNRFVSNRRKAKRREERASLTARIEEYKARMHAPKVIPDAFLFQHALASFEMYLENMRADTLKECIQIYEEERRHEIADVKAQMRQGEMMRQNQANADRAHADAQEQTAEIKNAPYVAASAFHITKK